MSRQKGEYDEEFRQIPGSVCLGQYVGGRVRSKVDANPAPANAAATYGCSAHGSATDAGATYCRAADRGPAYGGPDSSADRNSHGDRTAAPGHDHQYP
jgi:hypothetical protein